MRPYARLVPLSVKHQVDGGDAATGGDPPHQRSGQQVRCDQGGQESDDEDVAATWAAPALGDVRQGRQHVAAVTLYQRAAMLSRALAGGLIGAH